MQIEPFEITPIYTGDKITGLKISCDAALVTSCGVIDKYIIVNRHALIPTGDSDYTESVTNTSFSG